jgi:DNA-binding transcriptional MerR regulator
MSSPRQTWRVREFADRTGVTIKALRHYDRLGLLRPARTPAGHRLYSKDDLDRLRRILALKRIGIALIDMRPLLAADRTTLLARLAAKRKALTRERERLRDAERALAIVEESLRHAPEGEAGLSRLADVIEMLRASDQLKRYFTDEAWALARPFYQDWPDAAWIELCRDIVAAIPEGASSARAAELLERWNALAHSVWRRFAVDLRLSRELHEGFARAWRDRAAWPDTVRRRFDDYRVDAVSTFMRDASLAVVQPRAISA